MMISELQKFIDSDKIIFGFRECLKSVNSLSKIIVPVDCRKEVLEKINEKKISYEQIELTKKEIAEKIGINFQCEIFGVKR